MQWTRQMMRYQFVYFFGTEQIEHRLHQRYYHGTNGGKNACQDMTGINSTQLLFSITSNNSRCHQNIVMICNVISANHLNVQAWMLWILVSKKIRKSPNLFLYIYQILKMARKISRGLEKYVAALCTRLSLYSHNHWSLLY